MIEIQFYYLGAWHVRAAAHVKTTAEAVKYARREHQTHGWPLRVLVDGKVKETIGPQPT